MIGLSLLAILIPGLKNRYLVKTRAATNVLQCSSNLDQTTCKDMLDCSWVPFDCSTVSAGSMDCMPHTGCKQIPVYTSCYGKSETDCKNTNGCAPAYTTATYSCSNSYCPSSCTKKTIYSACTTSTCGNSGCSCSTSYYCTGPYYCSGLSYSGCSIKRSMGCGWSSRTTASGSYISGTSCTGSYTNSYYQSCAGKYQVGWQCTGSGYRCTGPIRECNFGDSYCPSTGGCMDGASSCGLAGPGSSISDYQMLCFGSGKWERVHCATVETYYCEPHSTSCHPLIDR